MHRTSLLSKNVLHLHHIKYSGLQTQCYVINTYDNTELSLTPPPPYYERKLVTPQFHFKPLKSPLERLTSITLPSTSIIPFNKKK